MIGKLQTREVLFKILGIKMEAREKAGLDLWSVARIFEHHEPPFGK
jgi:hypothetical protein